MFQSVVLPAATAAPAARRCCVRFVSAPAGAPAMRIQPSTSPDEDDREERAPRPSRPARRPAAAAAAAAAMAAKVSQRDCDQFASQGYVLLQRGVLDVDFDRLQQEYASVAAQAQSEIDARPPTATGSSYTRTGLIVVPESADPKLLCRFEFIAGGSPWMANTMVPALSAVVDRVVGQKMRLFKDKCNLKRPGGGAFPPHQDITAYQHFDSSWQLTAAVMLDPAVRANGALEMARDWNTRPAGVPLIATPRGPLPILPSYTGGKRNGDILDEFAHDMKWEMVEADAGSVILFDSYAPHRSQKNNSTSTRRILFFTFNLATDGDRYDGYYRAKRAAPNDPKFHVSTPTLHTAS